MNDNQVILPWGNEKITLTLPESWELAGTLEPSAVNGVADVMAEARRSLQEPFGCPHLAELVNPNMRIALIMDDGSRPTPVAQLLPAVLEELKRGGAGLDQITFVPALGVHRPMKGTEIIERAGAQDFQTFHWENPDCDSPDRMVYLGITSRGTPVYVNKVVAEADLVISICCIEPHIIASFGGGYKNLFPGVAGRATIAHNHALNCTPETFNMVGQPIENNPMRQDLEESGRMIKAPVFIINAVLNSSLQVVQIVSGDPITAHREGVKISASIYGVKIPSLADVIICSSHPMDQDLRQGVKALANNVRALRPGGVMITLVRAEEGVGVFGLANRKLPVGRTLLKLLAPLLLPQVPRLKLKGMGEEDRFFLYFALQAMRRGQLLLYAPTIPAEIHERLPFVQFVANMDDALARASRRFPQNARVLVIPHGGSTYPILPE